MKLGWLWLSILKMQAWPSPMSTTPAFSPGPWITLGPLVGNLDRCRREDLYEQCSDHMTLNTPSSTALGSRFNRRTIRSYSSDLRPYSSASSAMGLAATVMAAFYRDSRRRATVFALISSARRKRGTNRPPLELSYG